MVYDGVAPTILALGVAASLLLLLAVRGGGLWAAAAAARSAVAASAAVSVLAMVGRGEPSAVVAPTVSALGIVAPLRFVAAVWGGEVWGAGTCGRRAASWSAMAPLSAGNSCVGG